MGDTDRNKFHVIVKNQEDGPSFEALLLSKSAILFQIMSKARHQYSPSDNESGIVKSTKNLGTGDVLDDSVID